MSVGLTDCVGFAGGFSGARDEGQGRWGREPQAPSANASGDALAGGPRGSDSGSQLERGLSEQRSSLTLQPRTSSSSAASDPAKPKVSIKCSGGLFATAHRLMLPVCCPSACPAVCSMRHSGYLSRICVSLLGQKTDCRKLSNIAGKHSFSFT